MTTARALSENSRAQMMQVVIGLIEGKTPKDISAQHDVPYSRILRWQKDPDFLELYERTEVEVMTQLKSEAMDMIRARLDYLGPAAVAVLEEGLAADKMSDRLNAAKSILAMNGVGKTKATETATVIPIEQRIRERATDVSPTAGD